MLPILSVSKFLRENELSSSLSAIDRSLLYSIASYCGMTCHRTCKAFRSTLMRDAGIKGNTSYSESIKKMISMGLIEAKRRWKITTYRMGVVLSIPFSGIVSDQNISSIPSEGIDRFLLKESTIEKEIKDNNIYNISDIPKINKDKIMINEKDKSSFDQFISIYPVKSSKKLCSAFWKSRNFDQIASKIIDDVKMRLQKDSRWKLGHIKYPLEYLKERGWEENKIEVISNYDSQAIRCSAYNNIDDHDRIADLFMMLAANYLSFKSSIKSQNDYRNKKLLWASILQDYDTADLVAALVPSLRSYKTFAPTAAQYEDEIKKVIKRREEDEERRKAHILRLDDVAECKQTSRDAAKRHLKALRTKCGI